MNWTNTYPPSGVSGKEIITDHKPGAKIAEVVTEIQDKVVTEVETDFGLGIDDDGTNIQTNVLTIKASVNMTEIRNNLNLNGISGNVTVVTGVSLTTNGLEFSTTIMNFSDGILQSEGYGAPIVIPVQSC